MKSAGLRPSTPPQGRGFHEVLEEYLRFRVGYSPEVIEYLAGAVHGEAGAGTRYLDVACGSALLLSALAPRMGRAYGVDLSRALVAAAAGASSTEASCPAARPFSVAVAEAERLPFSEGVFDLVTVAQAYHWLDPKRALPELLRVLRPGGLLAVVSKYPAPEEPYVYLGDECFHGLCYPPRRAAYGVGNLLPLLDAGFVDHRRRVFPWDLSYTVESYVGWMRSREVLRVVGNARRAAALREFERRLRELVPGGEFVERNLQYVITARRPRS